MTELPIILSPVELADERIVELVQQGDKEQFGVLMARYDRKLVRYGAKFLSDPENITDIVQEIFISAYKNLQSFDTSQRFSPWIYRIAHNAFINSMRKGIRNPLSYIDFFDMDTLVPLSSGGDPERDMERSDDEERQEQERMSKMIEEGLDKISQKYREVLILYYLEELEYQDIADILEIPKSTVGIRLRRGKDALKKAYDKMNMHYDE
jgi:RNA polymerase sigma-70 factor, ECF subfamily